MYRQMGVPLSLQLLQGQRTFEESGGAVASDTLLDDARLPLSEVLRCAGVPWSARAVSRRFCSELEAGREALRVRWMTDDDSQFDSDWRGPSDGHCSGAADADPRRLRAMLSRLPWLETLDGSGCLPRHVASLARPQLTALKMSQCRYVSDLCPLAACTALRRLDVMGCAALADLSPLRACGLTALDISGCPRLVDITPLPALSALETLNMSLLNIENVGVLASVTKLRTLYMKGCLSLVDLAPLTSCKALTTLDVSDTGVFDLSPLTFCPTLATLIMSRCLQCFNIAITSLDVSECRHCSSAGLCKADVGQPEWLQSSRRHQLVGFLVRCS